MAEISCEVLLIQRQMSSTVLLKMKGERCFGRMIGLTLNACLWGVFEKVIGRQ